MNHLLTCRRTFVAILAIILLFVLGLKGQDVSMPIATICGALAAANSFQKKGTVNATEASSDA
jgi:hypothetical protein